MALPLAGTISLQDIQTEFGGSNPLGLNEYYKGGAYVSETDYAPNVPTSGPISLSDFYGAAKTTLYTYSYGSDAAIILPNTFRSPMTITALGGGGGAGGNDAGTPGYPGYAGKIVTATVSANPGDIVNVYIGGGGGGGRDGAIAPPGVGGTSNCGYYGGTGGASGGSGSSGSGGGGGAATVIQTNNNVRLVAAGGGGGGGAGNGPPGLPNNNNPGTNNAVNGGAGQPKSGDGGGGGGGGAGSPGGGSYPSPNVPVYPGYYAAYCAFLNTYGVWTNPDFVNPQNQLVTVNYTTTVNYSPGLFYAVASADNYMTMYVNGAPTVVSSSWSSTTTSGGFNNFNFGGQNTITITALNSGGGGYAGLALFAGAIYDANNNMIWNTRMISGAGGGGVGGATSGGDSGGYSGENGASLVPAGGSITTGSNGGASSTQPGSGGSATISYYA
jgi:mucin-19